MLGRSAFQRFDNPVLRAPSRHSQSLSDVLRRLMMAGVYRDRERQSRVGGARFTVGVEQSGQARILMDLDIVRECGLAADRMIN